jgi:hypothetical protein
MASLHTWGATWNYKGKKLVGLSGLKLSFEHTKGHFKQRSKVQDSRDQFEENQSKLDL